MKPIRPEDVGKVKSKKIPPLVIKAVNECIVNNWSDQKQNAEFTQNELVDEIITKYNGKINGDEIFNAGYLDIEPIFEKNGWKVEYDKPGYNENYYPATFTFTKKRNRKK